MLLLSTQMKPQDIAEEEIEELKAKIQRMATEAEAQFLVIEDLELQLEGQAIKMNRLNRTLRQY